MTNRIYSCTAQHSTAQHSTSKNFLQIFLLYTYISYVMDKYRILSDKYIPQDSVFLFV